MRRDDELFIIDVTTRLTDDEVEELLAGLAEYQRRKLARPTIPHWLAVIAGLAFSGAVWWTLAQIWLWRVGWLR